MAAVGFTEGVVGLNDDGVWIRAGRDGVAFSDKGAVS